MDTNYFDKAMEHAFKTETEKEELARVSKKAIEEGATVFVYGMSTLGAIEIITTTSDLKTKIKYILEACNDNLELSRCDDIKILDYMFL